MESINGLHLQPRDLALLRSLFECRIMTSAHVATLHFDGKSEATKKRLQKLKTAGLIAEQKRRMNEPAVLSLARKGFALLESHGVLAEYPQLGKESLEKRAHVSEITLRHELDVMDVKAAFHVALKKSPLLTTNEFTTWPLLNQFQVSRGNGAAMWVKPDGFIRIHEKDADDGLSEHTFFLEVDRSSETQDTLVAKAACYLDYYSSGGFAVRNGAPRSANKEYPFRVLMVFRNAERRNNTAERLLQNNPPIFTLAHLSTIEEATADPLGPVWVTPLAYREAVGGTPFDATQRRETWGYKRQVEREALVERMVSKQSLLF